MTLAIERTNNIAYHAWGVIPVKCQKSNYTLYTDYVAFACHVLLKTQLFFLSCFLWKQWFMHYLHVTVKKPPVGEARLAGSFRLRWHYYQIVPLLVHNSSWTNAIEKRVSARWIVWPKPVFFNPGLGFSKKGSWRIESCHLPLQNNSPSFISR